MAIWAGSKGFSNQAKLKRVHCLDAQNYLICYTYSYTSIYFIVGIEIYRILTGNKMQEHKTQELHEHV